MLRSPITVYRDWSKKQAVKKQVLGAFIVAERASRESGRPFVGLDLPQDDAVAAVALQELLREHPQLLVVRFKERMVLCRERAYTATTSDPTRQSIEQAGLLVRPGDFLHDDL